MIIIVIFCICIVVFEWKLFCYLCTYHFKTCNKCTVEQTSCIFCTLLKKHNNWRRRKFSKVTQETFWIEWIFFLLQDINFVLLLKIKIKLLINGWLNAARPIGSSFRQGYSTSQIIWGKVYFQVEIIRIAVPKMRSSSSIQVKMGENGARRNSAYVFSIQNKFKLKI